MPSLTERLSSKIKEVLGLAHPPGFAHSYIIALETIDRQRVEINQLRQQIRILKEYYNAER